MTIVASATPVGRSALATVRMSGRDVEAVLAAVVEPLRPGPWVSGRVRRVRLVDQSGVFDDGVLVFGRAPKTYTGEDTAEITCHGNPIIVERLLHAAVAAGARIAEAGEFSRRALVNGKLDLVRAEAVLQITHAASARGLDVGRAAMDGALGAFIATQRQELVDAAAELEARLDYPGDDLAIEDDAAVLSRLARVSESCRSLAATFEVGRVLVHGARVALVGAVNAGKSSLFNAMVGRTRALVHETPGTTRDVLEVVTEVGGVEITLLDTAGERRTTDPVEAAGLALGRELTDAADLLVVVVRAGPQAPDPAARAILERTADRPRVVVYNGVDAVDVAPVPEDWVRTVAVAGEGVDRLRSAIVAALGCHEATRSSTMMIASARQHDLLVQTAAAASRAMEGFEVAGVAAAADEAIVGITALDALTGADTRESVLDALFSRFCIGK